MAQAFLPVSAAHLPGAGNGVVGALLAAPRFRACSRDRQVTRGRPLKAKGAPDVGENCVCDARTDITAFGCLRFSLALDSLLGLCASFCCAIAMLLGAIRLIAGGSLL